MQADDFSRSQYVQSPGEFLPEKSSHSHNAEIFNMITAAKNAVPQKSPGRTRNHQNFQTEERSFVHYATELESIDRIVSH